MAIAACIRQFKRALVLVASISIMGVRASAQITDLSPVDGIGRFLDTRTGYAWLDFSPFYNQSYSEQVAHLLPGYQPATLAQVEQLTEFSMPLNSSDPSIFEYYFDVVGAANTQNREIIWGNFDILGRQTWHWANQWDDTWQTGAAPPDAYPDLGIWAVDTEGDVAAVPEPGSLTLLATALAAMFGPVRRRSARHRVG